MRDEELYQAYLDGDMTAFEQLVIRHRHNLVYFLYSFIKNYEIAEDAAQEVFAALIANPMCYNPAYCFKPFLYALAKRRGIDAIRRENKHTHAVPDENLKDLRCLEQQVFDKLDFEWSIDQINTLKDDYARVITLVTIFGFSTQQAAQILGKSTANIKVLLHRARKKLSQKGDCQ